MLLIDDILIIGFIAFIIMLIIMVLAKMQMARVVFFSIIYIYAVIVLGLTLFPIPYQAASSMSPVPNNFVPLKTIISVLRMGITYDSLVQILGNIIIAVPCGAIVRLVENQKRNPIVLSAFVFSVTIECLQLIIGCIIGVRYRSFDIDDIILNTSGVYIGYYVFALFFKTTIENVRSAIKKDCRKGTKE